MKRKAIDVELVWDTSHDPGWMLDILFADGRSEAFAPCPEWFHAERDLDDVEQELMITQTLKWESIEDERGLQ